MLISIKEKVASVRINLLKIKKDISKTFDIESSVLNNTQVRYTGENICPEDVKRMIFLGIEWGIMMEMMFENPGVKVMDAHIHRCQTTDKIDYKPEKISEDGREIELEVIKEDREEYFITNSLITDVNYTIKNHLNSSTFNFGLNPKWKIMCDINKR